MHKTLGPAAGAGLAVVLYIYLLLSCTAYLIIAADCLCPLLAGGGGGGAWWAGRHAVVAAVGLGVALPLSLPRTLEALSSEQRGTIDWLLGCDCGFVKGASRHA